MEKVLLLMSKAEPPNGMASRSTPVGCSGSDRTGEPHLNDCAFADKPRSHKTAQPLPALSLLGKPPFFDGCCEVPGDLPRAAGVGPLEVMTSPP